MRRMLPALAALLTLTVVSCSTARTVPRVDVTAPPARQQRFARFAAPDGQPVFGYTTVDGRYHELRGRARLAGDTLVFERLASPAGPLANAHATHTERVALADLASVSSEGVGTASAVIAATVMLGLAAFWVGFMILDSIR